MSLYPGELRPHNPLTAKFSDRCLYSVEHTMSSPKSSVEVCNTSFATSMMVTSFFHTKGQIYVESKLPLIGTCPNYKSIITALIGAGRNLTARRWVNTSMEASCADYLRGPVPISADCSEQATCFLREYAQRGEPTSQRGRYFCPSRSWPLDPFTAKFSGRCQCLYFIYEFIVRGCLKNLRGNATILPDELLGI